MAGSKKELEKEIAVAKRDYEIFRGFIRSIGNPDRILNETAEGLQKGLELYEEMEEKDAHVYSVLQRRKLALLSWEWDILPGGEKRADRKIAEFIKNEFKTHIEHTIEGLLDAIGKGFAVVEVIYKVEDKVRIKAIKQRAQTRFVFDLDGKLRLRTNEAPIDGIELPERKFIVMTFEGKNENPYGKGVLQKCFWPWWFKKHGVLFWSTFLEKFGQPTAVGKYPPGTPRDKQDALLEALEAIQTSYAIVIPENMKAELLEASRSGATDSYDKFLNYMDRQITKAVLSSVLATEEGKYGTRAQAGVHKEVSDEIVAADAKLVSRTINNTLVKWLVDFNFSVASYPEFVIRSKAQKAGKEEAERDKILIVDIGLRVPAKHLYEKYQIPEPAEDEEVLGGAKLPFKEGKETQFAEENEDEADRWIKKEGEYIDSLYDANYKDLLKAYDLRQIRKALEKSKNYDEAINKLNEYDPKKLNKVLERILLWANLFGIYQAGMQPTRFQEATEEDVDYVFRLVKPQEAIDYLKKKIPIDSEMWRSLRDEVLNAAFYIKGIERLVVTNAVKEKLLEALEQGKTYGQVKNDIIGILEKGGYPGFNEGRIRTVFYTNVYSAINAQHYRALQRVKDFLPYWQYKAVLDSRTRPTHAAMHNYAAPADDPIWDIWFPPNGFNCRCRVVGITKEKYASLPRVDSKDVQPDKGFANNPAKMKLEALKEALRNQDKYKEYLEGAIRTWLGLKRPAVEDLKITELPEIPSRLAVGKDFEYYWKFFERELQQSGKELYIDLPEEVAASIGVGKVKIVPESFKDILKRPDREAFLPLALKTLEDPFEVWEIRQSGRSPKYRFIGIFREGEKIKGALVIVDLKEGILYAFNKTGLSDLKIRRKGRFLYGK